jgi:hypothetical protein
MVQVILVYRNVASVEETVIATGGRIHASFFSPEGSDAEFVVLKDNEVVGCFGLQIRPPTLKPFKAVLTGEFRTAKKDYPVACEALSKENLAKVKIIRKNNSFLISRHIDDFVIKNGRRRLRHPQNIVSLLA